MHSPAVALVVLDSTSVVVTPRTGQGTPVIMINIFFFDRPIISRIGAGSFGEVYFGKWRDTKVAVKRLLTPISRNPLAQLRNPTPPGRPTGEPQPQPARTAQEPHAPGATNG
ncbi:hypothetical protein PAPYR_11766 [Paratrimastix pyriformis]|uniref:Protein kinase domain-containing protein n=1 Tax=Paratrimastix pyriformis TaxID=342808 RepID=A0ABQ8U330_9EUKA|nr:hypothetical protein PAPYR_11766 [Paratrimastix pyriformis]